MGYYGLCKVCNSQARDEIEALYNTTTYSKIVEQINSKYPELRLIPANLSNHRKHIEPITLSPEAVQSVEAVAADYSFEQIDKLPPPDIVRVADYKINRLWLLQQKRDLSPAEEQLLRTWTEIKLRIADQQLSRQQSVNTQAQAQTQIVAEELLKTLRQRAEVKQDGT